MIGKLILIAIVIGAAIFARHWWRKPGVTRKQRTQAIVLTVIAIMLVLAASGRLNLVVAMLAAVVPILWKLFAALSRDLPAAMRAWQLFTGNTTKTTDTASATIDRTEALQILGLSENASRDDIVNAHRRLIQKMHPDRGGSDYLAARINLAKDILLKDYA